MKDGVNINININVRSGLGAVRRRALRAFYRRTVSLGNCGPIVSFSFDDFPRTACSVGGAILEQFGARGTYYAAGGLMNTSNALGEQFRPADIDCLLQLGHEVASHTLSHISARSVSAAAFREDVKKGRKAIEELTGQDPTNFAYPFGHVTLRTKRSLGLGITSARSVIPGFNGPEIDLNLLRANSLYGDLEQSSHAEKLIAENAERKTWLIFYTHDVRRSPSAFGCTPGLLETAVSCAARSASRILTVREVLAELGVQNGNVSDHVQQYVRA